jgi:hypothetical protein
VVGPTIATEEFHGSCHTLVVLSCFLHKPKVAGPKGAADLTLEAQCKSIVEMGFVLLALI